MGCVQCEDVILNLVVCLFFGSCGPTERLQIRPKTQGRVDGIIYGFLTKYWHFK